MRLRNILLLYRVRLRSRLVQEVFAVLGIAVGVALLLSSQIARASLDGSLPQSLDGVVGNMRLQLDARSPQGFPERLLASVEGLPGVVAAMPVLEQRATLSGPRGQASIILASTAARSAGLGGPLLRHFAATQLERQQAIAVALPLAQAVGLSPLQVAHLQIGSRREQVFIGAVLLESEIGALTDSPAAMAPLPYAQRLSGMRGRVTSIYVQSAPGREGEVRRGLRRLAAGRLNVQSSDFAVRLFDQAAGPANKSALLFATLSALVGFLFALNAILFTVPQRRGLVEDLRLDGYSRRMIVEVLLFDALVLGAVASALGLLLGDLLSVLLFHGSPGYLSFAFSVGSRRIVPALSVAVAFGSGMLAALAGVLIPLRGDIFSRLSLQAGARRGARGARHAAEVLAVICLAIPVAVLVAAPRAATLGIVSLVAALLLLLPSANRAIVAACRLLARLRGGRALHLAAVELRSDSNRARSLAVAATGAIAVFASVSIQGAQGNLQRGLDDSVRDLDGYATLWATPYGPGNLLMTTAFPAASARRIARLSGVQSVQLYRGGLLDYGSRRTWVIAPARTVAHPVPLDQLVGGNPALVASRLRSGGWAALSQGIAAEHHLHVGQSFILPSPRPTTLRVAALITNMGWPPGAIVVNADDYARAWGSTDVSAYGITPDPGVAPARIARELRRALGPGSALVAETTRQRELRGRAASRQALASLLQITSLVLIAAVLAMVAAMGALIWQRRPHLADMKIDGFGRGVLWRALVVETALLLVGGCFIGALLGLYGQLLLSHALAVVTDFPVVYALGTPVVLTSLGLVTFAAFVVLLVPGYLAACVRPSILLQD
ncbi:MAG TPA: FtsX-like permease family protein [Solirubrobacteraceae bacterium]|nr:FtsX-like permease family protein [Solirubrobacteraceae bacterium]